VSPPPPVERPAAAAQIPQKDELSTPLEPNGCHSTGLPTPFELELKGSDGAEFRLKMSVESGHSWSSFPLMELVSGFWSRTRS